MIYELVIVIVLVYCGLMCDIFWLDNLVIMWCLGVDEFYFIYRLKIFRVWEFINKIIVDRIYLFSLFVWIKCV